MNLSEPFIRRPVMTAVLTVSVILFGVLSYRALPVNDLPAVDQPIMYIALTSDSVTAGQLYDYGSTQVGQRISILPGVSRVNVFGTKSAVRIKADPSAMWARGISVDDLSAAIRAGTSYTGAGQLDSSSGTAILRPQ